MTKRVLAVLPWALWSVTAAMGASDIVLTLLTPAAAGARMPDVDLMPGIKDYLFPVEAVLFATVGALIVSRRHNLIGWLMCVGAITYLIADAWAQRWVAFSGFVHPLPGIDWAAWLSAWVWIPNFTILLIGIPLLFPDGRPLTRRWGVVAWVVVGYMAVFTLMAALSPAATAGSSGGIAQYPFGPGFAIFDVVGPIIQGPGFLPMIALALIAGASLIIRYRRAGADVQHQIKWITAAYLVSIAGVPASQFFRHQTGLTAEITSNLSQILLSTVPIAVGVAIFRYHLYDIDNVISRTLVYGALAAFITTVYVGIVVGIGALIGSGGQPNLVLSIIATAIVAVAFQPVRERLQKIANRLVYGKRATPYEVLSQFSERVAESYAADDVLPRMARVLADGTGAARADVWLRAGDILRHATSWPAPPSAAEPAPLVGDALPEMPDTDRAVEVRHQGELLGALTVTKRRGESLTPVEEKLLTDPAGQAGLVLKNVGLTAELLARLEDLRASRQRLVAAQDEERRRLERNLHDGAQQNLVAIKVKLGLAEMFVEKDPVRAKQALSELKVDTDEALETLRDLARGIFPPLLADEGLVAALESQARKATLPVQVDADGVGRYPQEVEAAVYFCCLEALQNVQKYAAAQSAAVKLDGSKNGLTFEVTDDGKGFDSASVKRGAGLTNMTDRIDALGGRLEVSSTPKRGTRVHGSLPALVAVAPA